MRGGEERKAGQGREGFIRVGQLRQPSCTFILDSYPLMEITAIITRERR